MCIIQTGIFAPEFLIVCLKRGCCRIPVRPPDQLMQTMHVVPSEEQIREVLSFVHAEMLHVDVGGPAEREALDKLRQTVLRDPIQAQNVWMMLIQTCGEFAVRRSSIDLPYLQKLLLNSHIALQTQRSYREDIEHLQMYSQMIIHLLDQGEPYAPAHPK